VPAGDAADPEVYTTGGIGARTRGLEPGDVNRAIPR